MSFSVPRLRLALLGAALLALAFVATPARAAAPAPAWSITSVATDFTPGDSSGNQFYIVTATNVGGAPTDGTPIMITDTLPSGLTLDPAGASTQIGPGEENPSCNTTAPVICTDAEVVQPGQYFTIRVPVDIAAGVPATVTNSVEVSGGGAAAVSASSPDAVGSGPAGFGFRPGSEGISASFTNADGSADATAGSHPYAMTLSVNFNDDDENQLSNLDGALKDLTFNLPKGVVVDPGATPVLCTETELENDISNPSQDCPAASAVGLVTIDTYPIGTQTSPIYNMVPPAGVPQELGFDAVGSGVYVHAMGSVRTGTDYGLSSTSTDILAKLPVIGLHVTLWGNPSDASHDATRGDCAYSFTGQTCPVSADPAPFLTMPSACSGPLTTSVSADSWQNPGAFVSGTAQSTDASGNPLGITGCDRLDFTPTITAHPDVTTASSAAGFDFGLSVPQINGQTSLAEATLKKAVVTLPVGASLNPSAANGLQGCTPDEIQLNSASEPTCPDAAKVATVTINTPLLPDPLTGSVYLATPFDNPFDALAAGYIVAQADGTLLKLPGQFQLDPNTGRITASFDNNPELPFTHLELDFFGGPHGDLITPAQCGTYQVSSELTPWSSVTPSNSDGTPTANPSDSFAIDSNCSVGFSPSFTAGTENAQAGAYSPFVLSLSRTATDENFSGLSVTLPPGMLANLSHVQECSEQDLATISSQPGTGQGEINDPSCPANSQVGTVETSAGAGDPIQIPGKAYLTGPYKGAPYGLAVVVPAVAGPYDLGTVVVRQALRIDPTTAQVTDVSDPFPTILQGIPLDIRRIEVDLNRPDFTVNPTSCDPMSLTGTLTSTGSLTYTGDSHFQVGGCQDIGFSPKLKIDLSGKGKTRSGDHPTLTATLTQGRGQANIHSAKVTLPLSMALDPNNSQHVCAYAVAAAVHGGPVGCPTKTIVGTATADTPLLSNPLTGKVYLVQGLRCAKGSISAQGTCPGGKTAIHTLPTLLVPLRGQIALDLRAKSSVNGAGGLVTTFATIPDAPVSKFTLKITGGKKGLLVITGRGKSICGKAQMTDASFGAQSGKAMSSAVKMSTPCSKVKTASHHKRRKHKSKRHGKRGNSKSTRRADLVVDRRLS